MRAIPADVVACAIVAACRETGADPIAVASGETRGARREARARARAYAVVALRDVLGLPDAVCARVVGVAPESRKSFVWGLLKRIAEKPEWWSERALGRVSVAVRFAAFEHGAIGGDDPPEVPPEAPPPEPVAAPKPPPPKKQAPPPAKPKPEPPPYRPPPGTYEVALREKPRPRAKDNLGRVDDGGYRPPADAVEKMLAGKAEQRSKLQRMLAEAAANTARLPTPKE